MATRGRKSAVVPDGQVRVLWDGERSISDLHPEALPLTVICHDSQEMLRNFLTHSLISGSGTSNGATHSEAQWRSTLAAKVE